MGIDFYSCPLNNVSGTDTCFRLEVFLETVGVFLQVLCK